MGTLKNLVGSVFGRLTVISRSEKKSQSGAMWHCVCACGNTSEVVSLKLTKFLIVSCGCYRKENKPNLRHGQANKTTTYRTWKEMRQRCTNKNATQFQWYGGRGITICNRWSNYDNFLEDMGERPKGTSIDRKNVNGNYEPSNCVWATPKEQAVNNRGCFKKGQVPWNKVGPLSNLASPYSAA
jgi:hypothetical protein